MIIMARKKCNGNGKVKLAVLATNIDHIKNDISDIKEQFKDFDKKYVSEEEFDPVKKAVYGMIGVMLTSILVTIIAIAISSPW